MLNLMMIKWLLLHCQQWTRELIYDLSDCTNIKAIWFDIWLYQYKSWGMNTEKKYGSVWSSMNQPLRSRCISTHKNTECTAYDFVLNMSDGLFGVNYQNKALSRRFSMQGYLSKSMLIKRILCNIHCSKKSNIKSEFMLHVNPIYIKLSNLR